MRSIPEKFNKTKNRTKDPEILPLYVLLGETIKLNGRFKTSTSWYRCKFWKAGLGEIGFGAEKKEQILNPESQIKGVLKRRNHTKQQFWDEWWRGVRSSFLTRRGDDIDFFCSREERNFNPRLWIEEEMNDTKLPVMIINNLEEVKDWIKRMIEVIEAFTHHIIAQDPNNPSRHFRDPQKRTYYDYGGASDFERMIQWKYAIRILRKYLKRLENG